MNGRPVLLYDGDCAFCKRWVGWAHRHGADVDFRPCQDARTIRAAVGIPERRCKETAFYIDADGIRSHQDAINAVLRRIPGKRGLGWRAMARLGNVPGLHALEGMGYKWVAKNRHRLPGPKGKEPEHRESE